MAYKMSAPVVLVAISLDGCPNLCRASVLDGWYRLAFLLGVV